MWDKCWRAARKGEDAGTYSIQTVDVCLRVDLIPSEAFNTVTIVLGRKRSGQNVFSVLRRDLVLGDESQLDGCGSAGGRCSHGTDS